MKHTIVEKWPLGRKEYWENDNGAYHRLDGPAVIEYYPDGKPERETYYWNGILHRIGGPCNVRYYPSGQKKYEAYLVKGKNHRNDGPSHISYTKSGTILMVEYWVDGLIMNPNNHIYRLEQATNKNEALIKILQGAGKARILLAHILTERFKENLNPQVIANVKASVGLCGER